MKRLQKGIKENISWIIAFFCLIIFFSIIRLYLKDSLEVFDSTIYNFFSKYQNDTLTSIFKFISHLCGPITVIVLLFIILIFGKNEEYDMYCAIITTGAFIINYLVKIVFRRPRPLDINLITETGFSLPSSHAMVSVSFYGFLMYYVYKLDINKKKKILLEAILSILIILIGISRIYLGVHYASDVVAGMCLSIFYYILFIKLIYTKKKIKVPNKLNDIKKKIKRK